MIIAYKELRKLEIEIWQAILDTEAQQSFIYSEIQLTQFYGIEIDDFAHEIAKLSLWLAEHQMNKYFEAQIEQGQSKPILPLKASGNITHANDTRVDWEQVCPKAKDDEIYLLGHPPYFGYGKQNNQQKSDLEFVFNGFKNYKKLDYISCWFFKGANYILKSKATFAFVTTNSITQGKQVSLLWPFIIDKQLEIGFAYQTFKWSNSAKGNAGVSVVIINIRTLSDKPKYIFESNIAQVVTNINPYLTQAKNLIVYKESKPISNLLKMTKGSQPTDGGNLLLDINEKNNLLDKYSSFVRWQNYHLVSKSPIRALGISKLILINISEVSV